MERQISEPWVDIRILVKYQVPLVTRRVEDTVRAGDVTSIALPYSDAEIGPRDH